MIITVNVTLLHILFADSINNSVVLLKKRSGEVQRSNIISRQLPHKSEKMNFLKQNSSILDSSYSYAQELNQSAVRFLEIGQYDRAISTLMKTLHLWKEHGVHDETATSMNEACSCPMCCPNRWDRCSEIDFEKIGITSVSKSVGKRSQGIEDIDTEHPSCFDGVYVYQKMMQIPSRNQFGNHNVASAVSLIAIFNLAIVHHVRALRVNNGQPKTATTFQLYQLANDCLNRYITDTQCSCCSEVVDETGMLFQMILLNNASHLHSIVGNHSKYRQCIEQLISILMYVVDNKIRNNAQCRSSSIGMESLSLEGFFRNVICLVLTPAQCADAA